MKQLDPQNVSAEIGRLLGFGVTGLAAFLTYSVAMWVATAVAGLGQVAGAVAGFVLGTIVSYIGNSFWVFKVKANARIAAKFWIIILLGLMINMILASILEILLFPPLATVVIIFMTVPLLNYIGHRFWTFREPPSDTGSDGVRERQSVVPE